MQEDKNTGQKWIQTKEALNYEKNSKKIMDTLVMLCFTVNAGKTSVDFWHSVSYCNNNRATLEVYSTNLLLWLWKQPRHLVY